MVESALAVDGLILAAGVAAGALNSVAGGGSFLAFPALIFAGIPPIAANATNNLAMWVGTVGSMRGYAGELRPVWRPFLPAWSLALLGGAAGAWLLLVTPERTFTHLIPWLTLGATLIFALSPKLRGLHRGVEHPRFMTPVLLPLLLLTAVYGGYFGAGIGIVNLALLSLSGVTNIHRANALKVFLGFGINGIACIPFIAAGRIVWLDATLLSLGSIAGAYGGARIAQRLPQNVTRGLVVATGAIMTIVFFVMDRG